MNIKTMNIKTNNLPLNINKKTKNSLLTSALLVLLTASASQAALFWTPASASPNGEFTDGLHAIPGGLPPATVFGSAISHGVLTLDDGVTQVDYAVKLNSLSDLRHPADGAVAPSQLSNNMFAIHADGSADIYTAIQRTGHVDISICTFVLGTYNAASNSGTATSVAFGVTAPNMSPSTVTGSDGAAGSDIQRLNNNEQLFSTSAITLVDSAANQVETNLPDIALGVPHPTNLGNLTSVPTGFSSAFAWEAATGSASYGGNGELETGEADFNVTYAPTSILRLRRDTDRGLNSAFGIAAAAVVPEPSSALLLMVGLVAGGLRRQR